MKIPKVLAVIGAGVLLFAATDVVTYAATGSSLVLGKINQANAVTTIQNTSTGNALRLITKSAATAPLVVNGHGKVVNLYADRAATADNATKLAGKTTAQIVAGVPRPAGVIWVAKSGGQFTSVKAALASITNNGPAHPYVIKVAPGTYVETSPIVVKNFVDIEGSGRNRTTLYCGCSGPLPLTGSTVVESSVVDAEIRDLTITNSTNSANRTAYALSVQAPAPTFSIVHVGLSALNIAAGGGGYGLFVTAGLKGPHLDDLDVNVTGSPLTNVGVYLGSSSILRNSSINSSDRGLMTSGTSAVVASTIVGTLDGLFGHCTAVYTDTGGPVACT